MEINTVMLAFEKKLAGKIAIITGGASGIGACTARLFCQHGAKVVVADVQDDLGSFVCADLGPAASYIHCDVTNEDDVRLTVDHAVDKFGQLDIMFNNAGITGSFNHRIAEDEKAEFERVYGITAALTAGLAPHAYTCSKHAVVGLTRSAAAELGRHGIRVNCVSAATTATPMATEFTGLSGEEVEAIAEAGGNLKAARLKAEDIAKAVLYLAGDDARFVSGHNLVVDGGLTAVNPNFDYFKTADG